jgi:hypothetical protein
MQDMPWTETNEYLKVFCEERVYSRECCSICPFTRRGGRYGTFGRCYEERWVITFSFGFFSFFPLLLCSFVFLLVCIDFR